jgi:hypothetical protein
MGKATAGVHRRRGSGPGEHGAHWEGRAGGSRWEARMQLAYLFLSFLIFGYRHNYVL